MTAVATIATSDAGGRDHRARAAAPVRDGVPEAEHRDHEADLLLRQARRSGAERERQQAILVEEPDRAEQERRRERDRVEVVDDEPLRRRIEEVDEGEAEPRPVGAEVLAGEQEDGHGAERDGDGLDDEQQARVGPQPPERREERDQRVEVGSEPRDLVALEVGDLEEAGRAPSTRRPG